MLSSRESKEDEQRINGLPITICLNRDEKEFGTGLELNAGVHCFHYAVGTNFYFNYAVDFKLINFIDDSKSKSETAEGHITPDDYFFDVNLIDWDELTDEKKGFIRNGAIILEAKVTPGRCGLHPLPYDFSNSSELSDVVLVVGWCELYVSKQILAHHSSYFKALFYGNFKESNQSKIELKDLDYGECLLVLRLIYGDKSGMDCFMSAMKKLLPLLDRFGCEMLKNDAQVNIANRKIPYKIMLALASEYRLNYLLDHCMFRLDTSTIRTVMNSKEYQNLTSDIKDELQKKLESCLERGAGNSARMKGIPPEIPSPSFDFSIPSEISDIILVVEGKKLHVGKHFLALHSSYFKTLFFGDLNEFNDSEIELEDLIHEDFLILLNLIYGDRKQMNWSHMKQLMPLLSRFDCERLKYDAEMCIMAETGVPIETKIALACEYQLHFLMDDYIAKLDGSMVSVEYGKLPEDIKKELEKKMGYLEKSEEVVNAKRARLNDECEDGEESN